MVHERKKLFLFSFVLKSLTDNLYFFYRSVEYEESCGGSSLAEPIHADDQHASGNHHTARILHSSELRRDDSTDQYRSRPTERNDDGSYDADDTHSAHDTDQQRLSGSGPIRSGSIDDHESHRTFILSAYQ